MFERVANLFDRVIFKTAGRSLVFGIFLTILVQSSSITTSLVVPLVGAGVLTVAQVFPYTMGANIGTTCTALIAALAVSGGGADLQSEIALEVALHHVMFNIVGVAIVWWFRQVPIAMATRFAELAMRNRLLPLFYIITVFYILPVIIIFLF